MKRRTLLSLLLFTYLILWASICTAQKLVPVDSLEDWNISGGNWTFSGNSATSTNTGPNQLFSISKSYDGCLGFQGTVHISSLKGGAGCTIGKNIAQIGESERIVPNIHVGFQHISDGAQGFAPINCALRRILGYETLERYMFGSFGDWQYRPGQDIKIAISRVGNEAWYYVEGYGTRKFEPAFTMGKLGEMNDNIWFSLQTIADDNAQITATIKDVYIIYPSETHQPLEITFSPNPVEASAREGDVIYYNLTYTLYNPNNYPVEVMRFGQFNECLTTMDECLYSPDDFVSWFTFCDQPSTIIAAKGTYCDQEWWVSRTISAADVTGNYAFWYKDNEGTTRVAISESLTLSGLAQ